MEQQQQQQQQHLKMGKKGRDDAGPQQGPSCQGKRESNASDVGTGIITKKGLKKVRGIQQLRLEKERLRSGK
ncbi:hypothetical protein ACHAQJ_010193 [Trichoderma viride]